MTPTKILSLTLLGSVAGLAMLQPAMALDAQAFADRLAAVYERVGYTIDVADAKLKGDTVVLDGVTIGIRGMEASGQITTALTFSGVTEGDDGSYWAETVTAPDIEYDIVADVPGHVSLTDITLSSFYLPSDGNVDALAIMQLVGDIQTGPLSVTRNGQEVISFSSISASSTFNPEQGSDTLADVTTTFLVNDIAADLSSVSEEDPQAAAVIEALGLTQINGNISQSMHWNMADGNIEMGSFLFDFADIGSLDITMDLGGFTPALLDQMYDMQAQMLANGTDPASEEAQAQSMMVGMQMAQSILLKSVSIRYEDASLANRLIDFFAGAQGIERTQMVEGLKAMVPELVAGMGIPALGEVLSAPVAAFLDDPKSFDVSVEPANPTSLLVLTAAAANPAGLIDVLGLKVEANATE